MAILFNLKGPGDRQKLREGLGKEGRYRVLHEGERAKSKQRASKEQAIARSKQADSKLLSEQLEIN
jgi:type VI protein secretion system component VasF